MTFMLLVTVILISHSYHLSLYGLSNNEFIDQRQSQYGAKWSKSPVMFFHVPGYEMPLNRESKASFPFHLLKC